MKARALKPVLLMVARYNEDDIADTETTFHPTLADAKARAAEVATMGCDFGIYTLYQRGHIPSIKWDINTEPVANMLENTKHEVSSDVSDTPEVKNKPVAKRSAKRWTNKENKMLVDAFKDKWAYKEIGELLGRSEKSICIQVAKLRKLGMLPPRVTVGDLINEKKQSVI